MSEIPANAPPWLRIAYKELGVKEIPGNKHNPRILEYFQGIGTYWFKTDETPWCAAFVGWCLEQCDVQSSRKATAASYDHFGTSVSGEPQPGDICVFNRSGGTGHVGFFVRRDDAGRYCILGGNQSDQVKLSWFAAKPRAIRRPVLPAPETKLPPVPAPCPKAVAEDLAMAGSRTITEAKVAEQAVKTVVGTGVGVEIINQTAGWAENLLPSLNTLRQITDFMKSNFWIFAVALLVVVLCNLRNIKWARVSDAIDGLHIGKRKQETQ